MLEVRRNADDEGGDGATSRSTGDVLSRFQRIRCPKCAWQPQKHHRWYCHCGHCWNTFETRGVCPGCHFVWQQTACHRCEQWSAHADWYEKNP